MAAGTSDDEGGSGALPAMSLAALGVVYGDIGTSPLYALRECFFGAYAVAPNSANVLGVLSLITWSLILVISVNIWCSSCVPTTMAKAAYIW